MYLPCFPDEVTVRFPGALLPRKGGSESALHNAPAPLLEPAQCRGKAVDGQLARVARKHSARHGVYEVARYLRAKPGDKVGEKGCNSFNKYKFNNISSVLEFKFIETIAVSFSYNIDNPRLGDDVFYS